MIPAKVASLSESMAAQDYVLSEGLAVSLFLALRQSRPLFLEGEAGVGKTEVAKTLAALLDRRLIRLQCYEGLDINAAAYEWNYARQMMQIQSAGQGKLESADLFTEDNLIERPLLEALREDARGAPVLLIDELDRADEAFEAYLLEVLSDFQVTIPELGTIKAAEPPIVIITSNRTREIHDALKRRCFYHWVDYPDAAREAEIIRLKAPGASEELTQQIVGFIQSVRGMDMFKLPGVAESIDWTNALMQLNALVLDPAVVNDTLGVLLKYQDDIQRLQGSEAQRILAEVNASLAEARREGL